jgi:hypothetical protein
MVPLPARSASPVVRDELIGLAATATLGEG